VELEASCRILWRGWGMWLEGGAGRGWVSSEKILIGWQDGVEHGWKEEGEEASGYEGTPVSSGGVSGTQSSC